MYNIENDSLIQSIKYKLFQFDIYNRDLISSEENQLGYRKEIVGLPVLERIDRNNSVIDLKGERKRYNLSWDLFLSEERFFNFLSLYNAYLEDLYNSIDNSIMIYTPNVPLLGDLILEDNRLIDFFYSTYKEYKIHITNISPIEEFFFREKFVKFSMEAETL